MRMAGNGDAAWLPEAEREDKPAKNHSPPYAPAKFQSLPDRLPILPMDDRQPGQIKEPSYPTGMDDGSHDPHRGSTVLSPRHSLIPPFYKKNK